MLFVPSVCNLVSAFFNRFKLLITSCGIVTKLVIRVLIVLLFAVSNVIKFLLLSYVCL